MKTYLQIESSRNRRLWITEVFIPLASLATVMVASMPETRQPIVRFAGRAKNSVKKVFKKKESEDDRKVIIRVNAKDRQEALKALEAMAKVVIESGEEDKPINKIVRMKDYRKA